MLKALSAFFVFVNALIGLIVCVDSSYFFDLGGLIFAFAIISLLFALKRFDYSILFQARLILLVVIGYFAGLVKLIDPRLAFSPVSVDVQTFDVGVRMFGLTSIALFGSFLGFMFSEANVFGRHRIGTGMSASAPIYALASTSMPWLHWMVMACVGVIVTGYYSAISYGPSVFEGVYGQGEGAGQLLGNLQSIGVVCLVIVFVCASKIGKPALMWLGFMLAVYFLGWGILLRGGRLEVLSGLLALFVCIPAAKGQIARLRGVHYLAIIAMIVFMEAWGNLRSTLSQGNASSEQVIEGYARMADSGVYFAGTVSGIATTFANLLDMVDKSVVGMSFGTTYLDYFLRSPPEFLYPGRPADLSSIFEIYGYPSVGGFFELAEAYLNFGVLGCLVMPFLISFGLSKIYQAALKQKWLYFFLLIALISVFFRGAWYQTFAFYKSLLTGLILFMVFNFKYSKGLIK